MAVPRAAPGEFAFDPVLRDLAAHTDRATARTTAKYTEYPDGHLRLTGGAWPWRPTLLCAATLMVAAGLGLLPTLISSRRRVTMHPSRSSTARAR